MTGKTAPESHSKVVLLVGREWDWPPELIPSLGAEGYVAHVVADLSALPRVLGDDWLGALFIPARPLGASELLTLRQIRELSPRTAIVAVTSTPTDPDLKRAFESGATAFLSWPASPGALRHAVESGAPAVRAAPRQGALQGNRT